MKRYAPKVKRKALWVTAFPDQVKRSPKLWRPKKIGMTEERKLELKAYALKARQFLEELRRSGKTCPVMARFDELPPEAQQYLTVAWTGNRRSNKITECHHRYGRAGRLLLWKDGWMGVSKQGHRLIHKFKKLAREMGWLARTRWWENPESMDPKKHRPTPIDYPSKR